MISVLVATRGRPKKLENLIRSIDVPAEIIIVPTYDTDVTASIRNDKRVAVLEMDRGHSVVAAYNHAASGSKYDLLSTSDDVEYCPGSIGEAKRELNESFDNDGIIGFNTINMDSNEDAFMLIGRKFFTTRMKGVLWHPEYLHFYVDTELGDYARSIGRFKFCKTATMINHHPSSGEAADETHKLNRTEKCNHDFSIYQRRKTEIFR